MLERRKGEKDEAWNAVVVVANRPGVSLSLRLRREYFSVKLQDGFRRHYFLYGLWRQAKFWTNYQDYQQYSETTDKSTGKGKGLYFLKVLCGFENLREYFEFQEFEVSNTSILMMTIASLGFAINLVAAFFLTYKMKTNHSPFLRFVNF